MATVVKHGHNCKNELRRDIKNAELGTVARCSCGALWKVPSDVFSAAVLGWVLVKPEDDVPDMRVS